MWDIFKMIMLPIGAGLILNRLLHGRSAWLDKAMPLVSMAGIGMVILIVTAAGRKPVEDWRTPDSAGIHS